MIGHLRIKGHVYIKRRGTTRFQVCARDTTHVWVRLVGQPDSDLERFVHEDVLPIIVPFDIDK